MAEQDGEVKMDISDVEWRLGHHVGGGELWEQCNKTDIRRWVMAMDYVNPLHWDQRFAREKKFGDIICPQSMLVALDYGHGNNQARVGRIDGQHLIFGGEEWWWYGPYVRPGDHINHVSSVTLSDVLPGGNHEHQILSDINFGNWGARRSDFGSVHGIGSGCGPHQ